MSSLAELKHKDVTDKILRAFFKVVYPQLGYGFLEKIYENAMAIALRQRFRRSSASSLEARFGSCGRST